MAQQLQTVNENTSVIARQAIYARAGVKKDAVCGDSGATAQEIAELWADCNGNQTLFDEKFKELAELNGASGQCSGHCVKILDALKAQS